MAEVVTAATLEHYLRFFVYFAKTTEYSSSLGATKVFALCEGFMMSESKVLKQENRMKKKKDIIVFTFVIASISCFHSQSSRENCFFS